MSTLAAAVAGIEAERSTVAAELKHLQGRMHALDEALKVLSPLLERDEPKPEVAPAAEPDPEPEPMSDPAYEAKRRALDEVLALLEHPEWVEGAVLVRSAWERADGEDWTCSCPKRCRTLGHLRNHLRTVVNPLEHHPPIRKAVVVNVTRKPDPEPKPEPVLDLRSLPTNANGLVTDLPFGCSCYARFPELKDYNAHVSEQPQRERRRHRLVAQPRARFVEGGPHPKARREPLKPAVAALADHAKPQLHRSDVGAVSV